MTPIYQTGIITTELRWSKKIQQFDEDVMNKQRERAFGPLSLLVHYCTFAIDCGIARY